MFFADTDTHVNDGVTGLAINANKMIFVVFIVLGLFDFVRQRYKKNLKQIRTGVTLR